MIWLVHPDSLQTFFKLVYAMLHQKGQLNVGYIDDSYVHVQFKGRALRTGKPILMILVIYSQSWVLFYCW